VGTGCSTWGLVLDKGNWDLDNGKVPLFVLEGKRVGIIFMVGSTVSCFAWHC